MIKMPRMMLTVTPRNGRAATPADFQWRCLENEMGYAEKNVENAVDKEDIDSKTDEDWLH
jgi:hypothetical protein